MVTAKYAYDLDPMRSEQADYAVHAYSVWEPRNKLTRKSSAMLGYNHLSKLRHCELIVT